MARLLLPRSAADAESSGAPDGGPFSARSYDVVIVGGGIIGVSAAAFAAETGLSVALFEGAESLREHRSELRFVPAPIRSLHGRAQPPTVTEYRELSKVTDFQLPKEPAGLQTLSADLAVVTRSAASIAQIAPTCGRACSTPVALHELEPSLAPDLVACRLDPGYLARPQRPPTLSRRELAPPGQRSRSVQAALKSGWRRPRSWSATGLRPRRPLTRFPGRGWTVDARPCSRDGQSRRRSPACGVWLCPFVWRVRQSRGRMVSRTVTRLTSC